MPSRPLFADTVAEVRLQTRTYVQALKIAKGEKVEKTITLPTATVDKTNAQQILKENGLS